MIKQDECNREFHAACPSEEHPKIIKCDCHCHKVALLQPGEFFDRLTATQKQAYQESINRADEQGLDIEVQDSLDIFELLPKHLRYLPGEGS